MAVGAITAAAGKLQSSRVAFDLRSTQRVHDTEDLLRENSHESDFLLEMGSQSPHRLVLQISTTVS